MRHCAIVTDDPGWHGAKIKDAFLSKGVKATFVSLQECFFSFSEKTDIIIPGFEKCLPDGVFVRGVPGGTLEEVVFYLDILHMLSEKNILVYNSASCIEKSVDKIRTTALLESAGFNTPKTWVSSSLIRTRNFLSEYLSLGNEVICKPIFGSQGKGMIKLDKNNSYLDLDVSNGVYYLQEFIHTKADKNTDWRVFVIANKVIATMRRESQHWQTNVAQGGECYKDESSMDMQKASEKAASLVGANYAGIDILIDENNKVWITEINSVPAWKGLESTCNIDIANLLVDDFLEKLEK